MKEAVFEVYRLYGGRGIEQVGEITNVLSYHINLNYNECDTFSFKVINDRDNSRLLQIGYMIRCLSAHYYEQLDAEKLGLEDFYFDGIIESVIYSQDEQGIEYIEVTGRDVSCLLERRIVYRYGVGEWFYDGNIQGLIKGLITDNTIEPDDTNRHINFKYLELPKKTIPIIDIMRQMSGNENILQVLCDVCVANDIGFRAFVEITDVDFYVNFWLYKGKENTNVISAEEGNLLSYDYAKSELDYRNAVYCLGKENIFYCVEENMRERAFTPPFGEDRQEAFLDCTSIDNHYQENKYAWVTNPQTGEEEWEQIAEKGKTLIPTEEYRSILQQRGIEYLKNHQKIASFNCVILSNYSRQFEIGDWVVIELPSGQVEARIVKIEKIIEGNKETNNYSIGNVVMTTEQKLRKFI